MASLINSAGATGTGSMTIQGPNTNSNQVLTIPDATGTAMVSGNMPAFSAYGSAFQSLATTTFTKIQYNTKDFDTASCYDNTTNYRFTPNVSGYYQVNAIIASAANASGVVNLVIYKNGSAFKAGGYVANSALGGPNLLASALLYLNGSTDYIEIYGYQSSGGSLNVGAPNSQFSFSAILVRTA